MSQCVGGTGSLHAKEGRDRRQAAFRNSSPLTSTLQPLVFLILWNGRIHAQLLLVAPLLETPCLDSFAEVLLPLGEASGNPRPLLCPKCTQEGWAAAAHAPLALLHLIQGTWKPLSHHPPTPLSHLPHPTGMLERGYVFIQTSQFIPVIPLLTWMG